MKVFYSIIVFFFITTSCFAQIEANEWLFGEYCRLSFATGKPVSQGQSSLKTIEGSASVCDENGRLLFYTDGATVWNANHQIMSNGTDLSAGKSATQGAIIVPHPGNNKTYYIFTAADRTGGSMRGFHYSVVNMELAGGLGAISEKNVQLIKDNISEAVTATLDCSGKGIWVITHTENGNTFHAFHVTTLGVNNNPISSIFPGTQAPYFQPFIKVSPNTRSIALTSNVNRNNPVPGPEALTLYDFNNETGYLSNKQIIMGGKSEGCYGASFSSDNTKLYVGQQEAATDIYRDSAIAQFDISVQSEPAIRASKVNLPRKFAPAAMQLAINGEIYIALGSVLGGIKQPNLAGKACGYSANALDLKGTYAQIGISNFPDYYFQQGKRLLKCAVPKADFMPDTICAGKTIQFTDNTDNFPKTWYWKFEGGQPSEYTGQNPPPIFYAAPGGFKTTLIATNGFGGDTLEQIVLVRPQLFIDAGLDAVICSNGSALLGSDNIATHTYSWTPSTGLNNTTIARPIANPASTTRYYLRVINEFGCEETDSVLVTVGEIRASATPDSSVCFGSAVVLKASGGSEYSWSPAVGLDITSGAIVTASPASTTRYRVIASGGTGALCQDTTFVTVVVHDVPNISAGSDKVMCEGESITLGSSANSPAFQYKWTPISGLNNPALANPTATLMETTEYYVEATNEFGCISYDTVLVQITNLLTLDAGNDLTACQNDSTQLTAVSNTPNLLYKWTPTTGLSNPAIANPLASPDITTTYYVTATKQNGFCEIIDSLKITVLPAPIVNVQDTTLCPNEPAELVITAESATPVVSYQWSPATGLNRTDIPNPIVTINQTQGYTVTVTNAAGCSTKRTLTVTIKGKEKVTGLLSTDTQSIDPGESTQVKLLLRSENSEKGILSFKATVTYDRSAFQYVTDSFAFLNGADNSWSVTSRQIALGEILVEATGTTPTFNAELSFEIAAYLADQTQESILLKINEINGESTGGTLSCRMVETGNTELLLNDVCGGDLRLIRIGTFQTALRQIMPNPISEEEATIEYSIGIAGDVAVTIYNQRGELLKIIAQGFHTSGIYSAVLNTSEFSAGVYMCKMTTTQSTVTKQFIIIE